MTDREYASIVTPSDFNKRYAGYSSADKFKCLLYFMQQYLMAYENTDQIKVLRKHSNRYQQLTQYRDKLDAYFRQQKNIIWSKDNGDDDDDEEDDFMNVSFRHLRVVAWDNTIPVKIDDVEMAETGDWRKYDEKRTKFVSGNTSFTKATLDAVIERESELISELFDEFDAYMKKFDFYNTIIAKMISTPLRIGYANEEQQDEVKRLVDRYQNLLHLMDVHADVVTHSRTHSRPSVNQWRRRMDAVNTLLGQAVAWIATNVGSWETESAARKKKSVFQLDAAMFRVDRMGRLQPIIDQMKRDNQLCVRYGITDGENVEQKEIVDLSAMISLAYDDINNTTEECAADVMFTEDVPKRSELIERYVRTHQPLAPSADNDLSPAASAANTSTTSASPTGSASPGATPISPTLYADNTSSMIFNAIDYSTRIHPSLHGKLRHLIARYHTALKFESKDTFLATQKEIDALETYYVVPHDSAAEEEERERAIRLAMSTYNSTYEHEVMNSRHSRAKGQDALRARQDLVVQQRAARAEAISRGSNVSPKSDGKPKPDSKSKKDGKAKKGKDDE